jgi:hypothetical protein
MKLDKRFKKRSPEAAARRLASVKATETRLRNAAKK